MLRAGLRRGCSRRASSAATSWSRSAAAWSAISPASPRRWCAAASISCRCRRRCWRRSIPRSAARPAINSGHGKNLVGAFHQPILVLADTALLDTLPEREFRAGYAEVVKYGLLGDARILRVAEAELAGRVRGRPARGNARTANTRLERAGQGRDRRAATSARPATACCSISATPSVMRSKLPPDFPTSCCTAKRSGSAWRWRSSSPRGAGLLPKADAERAIRHLAAVGLPTHIKDVPGVTFDARFADGADRPGQEGEARRADLHPGARHRPELSSRATSRRPTCARSSPRNCDRRRHERSTVANLLLALLLLAANAFYRRRASSRWSRRAASASTRMAEENRFGARLVQRMLAQHRGISRLLPAWHHDGFARPRLGRRADRVGAACIRFWCRSACPSLRCTSRRSWSASWCSRRCTSWSASRCRRRWRSASRSRCRSGSPIRSTVSFLVLYPLNWLLNTASRFDPAPARREGKLAPGDPHRRRDRGAGRGVRRARQDGARAGRVHPERVPVRRASGLRRDEAPHRDGDRQRRR